MSNTENQKGRRAVLAALGALGAGAAATMALKPASLQDALGVLEELPATDALPVVFVGHGTPFSVIDPNVWTREWTRVGQTLPRPAAILMISAHWLTEGASLVTASTAPAMNYDIRGFPQAIYEFRYPAPGHPTVAREVERALQGQTRVQGDTSWGLDHGTWLPLKYMFPAADIPVLQLSVDYSRPPAFHYELAKRLRTLRSKGVLIIGSGNVVHNLGERGGTGVTETPRGRWSSIGGWRRRWRADVMRTRSTSSRSARSRGSRIRRTITSCRSSMRSVWSNRVGRCRRSAKGFSGRASACARSCWRDDLLARRQRFDSSVEEEFLAVRHHDPLQLSHVGSVGEAKADSGDDVSWFQRLLVPAIDRHVFLVRAADLPLFDRPVGGLDVERDHHVRIGPRISGHGSPDHDLLGLIDRPRMMRE
jgi:hypothetical protein